jgi:hypothetical protein
MVRRAGALMWAVLLGSPTAAADTPPSTTPTPALPGYYSNEEQVYFAKEAGRQAPPLLFVAVDDALRMRATDAFGTATGQSVDGMTLTADARGNLTAQLPGGPILNLRRARPATCWVAIKKGAPKADGSPDWHFQQGVTLHDQGGRALVGGGATGAQPLVIRMRNVVWPPKADGTPNTNKPSIVLYVHKPDKPDSAESYVWADPGAARIGINLRWMQASCGIDGMEQPVP